MFVRAFTLVLAIAASVIAVPGGTTNQCNTGSMQCCNNVAPASSVDESILALFGVGALQNVDAGLDCNPISVIGAGSGASCTQQPVCCSDMKNYGNQLVGMNCSPINVNL
ncbi:hypothetical protein HD554DRAFT_2170634 [Boletus coccyginus]|nr:hypothetical protein HD554DRAFT_2170634 [Boletus coccyginus]